MSPMEALQGLTQLGVKVPFTSQLSLLKYGPLKASEITGDHIGEISNLLGFAPSREDADALARIVNTNDSDSLGDWLTRPDNFEHVKKLIAKHIVRPSDDAAAQCPWCDSLFKTKDLTQQIDPSDPASAVVVQCPVCNGSFVIKEL